MASLARVVRGWPTCSAGRQFNAELRGGARPGISSIHDATASTAPFSEAAAAAVFATTTLLTAIAATASASTLSVAIAATTSAATRQATAYAITTAGANAAATTATTAT